MKALLLSILFTAHLAYADSETPLQRYQCDDGVSLQIRITSPESIELQTEGSNLSLPQVIAASGVKYGDGRTAVWLKDNTAFMEQDNVIVANNCTRVADDEPLSSIRDAASGLIFIPPDRWLADQVQIDAKSGPEIPFYGETATQQFEFRFRAGKPNQKYSLLDILVFPKSVWNKLTPKPRGEVLGNDGQRVYLAQLPAHNPFDPTSKAGKEFIALQTNNKEVQQAFSMYGNIKRPAVEQVSAKITWLDRRLYPGAVLTVEIKETSKMDFPNQIIAKQIITLNEGKPTSVNLQFSPDAINPRNRYSVGARLEMDGKLIKINDSPVPIFGRDMERDVIVRLKNI